jgi:hypothetical protein
VFFENLADWIRHLMAASALVHDPPRGTPRNLF